MWPQPPEMDGQMDVFVLCVGSWDVCGGVGCGLHAQLEVGVNAWGSRQSLVNGSFIKSSCS